MNYIITIMPTAAFFALLLSLPVWFLSRRRNGYLYPARRFALMGFVGTITATLLATIFLTFPLHFTDDHLRNLKPFVFMQETYTMGYTKMVEQLFLNAAMFVPFGLLLPVIFPKMRHFLCTGLTSLLFTLSIETFQYFIGRAADIDDVIMNFTGGVIGYLTFALCRIILKKCIWWQKALGSSSGDLVFLHIPGCSHGGIRTHRKERACHPGIRPDNAPSILRLQHQNIRTEAPFHGKRCQHMVP